MKKLRKLSGILALAMILSIFASGCSTGGAGSSSSTSTESSQQTSSATESSQTESVEPYELSVAWWGGEARHEKTLEMIDAYMEKYPEATIVSQYAAYTDYFTKLATQAAGGNLPDVYLVQLTYLGEYASKGLMRPLQDLVDAGKIDVSKFTSGALSGSSYNGELVGITFGDTASCIVYNKSLLERVGYDMPEDQMLYSDFADYLKGLVPLLPEGSYAMQLGSHHEHSIENYVRQRGCYGLTTEDGKELGYTKEIMADYWNYWYDLFLAGVNGPIEVILDDRSKQFADSLMGHGQIAFWYTNCNQAKIYQATMEDELEIMRAPLADDYTNQYVEAAVCSTWAISGKTDKVDQAAQFINEMVNNWELQEIYDMDIGVPGSTEIQDKLIAEVDDTDPVDYMKKREIEVMQDILGTIEPFNGRPSGYPAVVEDNYKKMDEILYGNMTVDQAIEAHFAMAQTLLA